MGCKTNLIIAMRMKKNLFALIMCITTVIALNANTIEQNGVYVTVAKITGSGSNGYGDWIDVRFSLSSNENVTVHVQVENSKGEIVADKWVDLAPKYKVATASFTQLYGKGYRVTLVQH